MIIFLSHLPLLLHYYMTGMRVLKLEDFHCETSEEAF